VASWAPAAESLAICTHSASRVQSDRVRIHLRNRQLILGILAAALGCDVSRAAPIHAPDAAIAGLGSPCSEDEIWWQENPCPQYGLQCSFAVLVVRENGTSWGSCQLPGVRSDCSPSVGCAGDATICASSPAHPDSFECAYACASTSDCPDLQTTCDLTHGGCFENYCAVKTCGTPPSDWGPCTVDGQESGMCISTPCESPPLTGFCTQVGAVGLGQPCSPQRHGHGSDDLCAAGTGCFTFDGGSGFCAALFGISGQGGMQRCANGDSVVSLGWLGYCLESCDPQGLRDSCPPDFHCVRLYDLFPPDGGVCVR
jgi:hypothetical protein